MQFLIAVLIVAVALGYALGGRLRHLGDIHLRWWGLAILGLAMQLFPTSGESDVQRLVATSLLIASYPVLMLFAVANIRMAGFGLVLLGLMLNFIVIATNQGMPVTRHALVASGQGEHIDELPTDSGSKHFLAQPGDVVLLPLADVIPIGDPINVVLSVGDFVVYGGVMWLVIAAMRGQPYLIASRPRREEPARSSHPGSPAAR